MVSWEDLPSKMKNEEVKKYYNILQKRKFSLIIKRITDLIIAFVLTAVLLPVFLIIYFIIKADSPGKAVFKQDRVTAYGKIFKVFKFRTMVENAQSLGPCITSGQDGRITKCGLWLRKFRLDEITQLFNIIRGELSFVGARPEAVKYVQKYSSEMYASLLLPAGVTSLASILYKDEAQLLEKSKNPEETYINEILPEKMKYNLEYIKKFNLFYDIKIMIKTVVAVIFK